MERSCLYNHIDTGYFNPLRTNVSPTLVSRSFAKPPQQVQTVCECVVIMRGFKEVSWKTAKGMMSDTNFLNSLKNMDVDGITVSQVNIM